jgi:type 1 fimbria pilin
MKTFRKIIFCVLGLFYGIPALACNLNFTGGSSTINYGNITVQRDAPIGSAISVEITGNMQPAYTCVTTGGEGSSAGIYSNILTFAFVGSDGSRVYNTNVPGVGISFAYNGNERAGASTFNGREGTIGIGGTTGTGADYYTDYWTSNPGETDSYSLQPVIKLWKTANIVSGSLSGQLASFVFNSNQYRTGSWGPNIAIVAGSGSITQVACSITTPSLTFPIGNILATTFGTTVGTTPSGAQNTQNLGLNCDAKANINVSLSGTQNPDVGTTSILALTGQSTAGVAKGVGVQILYNGTPLILNNRIVLKQSSGGQETFPLIARYYQTKTSVSTGSANASATLNLTYQ